MSRKEFDSMWTSEEKKKVKVVVRGREYEVEENKDFTSTIIELAKQEGLYSFSVKVDGREIEPEDAPATFSGIGIVVVEPYNKAGLR